MRQYSRETTLAEVIEDLRAQPVRLPVSFRLAMGLPRRVFQAEDESSTVADLGLTPSASVAVQPCSTQVITALGFIYFADEVGYLVAGSKSTYRFSLILRIIYSIDCYANLVNDA